MSESTRYKTKDKSREKPFLLKNFDGMMIKFLTACALVSALPFATSYRDTSLKVTSDGPAVLDAKINFRAVLIDSDSFSGPFYFRWSKSFLDRYLSWSIFVVVVFNAEWFDVTYMYILKNVLQKYTFMGRSLCLSSLLICEPQLICIFVF